MRRLLSLFLLAASIACGQIYRVGDRLFVNLGNYPAFSGDGAGGACITGDIGGHYGLHRISQDGTARLAVNPNDPVFNGRYVGGNHFLECDEKQMWFTASQATQNVLALQDGQIKILFQPGQILTRTENGQTLTDQRFHRVATLSMRNSHLIVAYWFSKLSDIQVLMEYPTHAQINQQLHTLVTLANPFTKVSQGIDRGHIGCSTSSSNYWTSEWSVSGSVSINRYDTTGTKTFGVPEVTVSATNEGVTCIGDSAILHFKDSAGQFHVERVRDGSNTREQILPVGGSVAGLPFSNLKSHEGTTDGKLVFLMETTPGKNALVEIDPDGKSAKVLKHSEVSPAGEMLKVRTSGTRLLVEQKASNLTGPEVYLVLKPDIPTQTPSSTEEGGTVRVVCKDCYLKDKVSPQAFIGDRSVEVIPSADYLDLKVPASIAAGEYPVRIQVSEFTFSLKLKVERSAITAPYIFGDKLQNVSRDPTGKTLVSESNPARPGDWITMYGVNFNFAAATEETPKAAAEPVKVWIKTAPGEYREIELRTYQFSPEVTQINFQVPLDLNVPQKVTGYLLISVSGVLITAGREEMYPIHLAVPD